MKSDIKVKGSEEMKRQGRKKGWRKCKYLKNELMLKNYYKKIIKK